VSQTPHWIKRMRNRVAGTYKTRPRGSASLLTLRGRAAATFRLSICLAILTAPIAQADCLKEGQEVTFTGSISRETFPGRPNYSSIDDGDEPETVWILTIASPNCVVAKSMEDGQTYEVAKSTTRFQLVFPDANEYGRHKSLVENQARIRGQIRVGYTGHHHTKAMIEVQEIHAADEK